MKRSARQTFAVAIAVACAASGAMAQTRSLEAALTRGKVNGQLNLRYEGVSEDNALQDAKALTLRTALKYTTATLNGFSAVLEVEDVSSVGLDDYSVPPSGFNTGRYSVIPDPETTELNQVYLQYANAGFQARLGRQDIRYDNQRFVGAVPWRQDYQSFDALSLQYKMDAAKAWTVNYHYITQRERIFAQDADIKSKDHLLHGVIATPIGSLTAYAWLLEEDIALHNQLDTYGLRLTGSRRVLGKYDATYLAEFATQDYERGPASYSTNFYHLEGGVTLEGVTAKLGIESLGSDGGAYGFATPLATLHAFQGWADQFLATPNQGIDDWYLSLGKAVAGGTLSFIYHDFSAEQATPVVKDLGKEYNLQWIRPIRNNYQFGLKYANYRQGDLMAKADKQIIWTWMQVNF
jgi:hypothetical protein